MPKLGLGFSLAGASLVSRFSPAARDYFRRLDAADLRVNTYDAVNARFIDRLVANGGNFWPDSGAFNAMAGYLFPTGGTLIPLHPSHDAGTLNAFVSGDWNAVTGLKGNPAASTFVDSNRNYRDDGQNDNHGAVFVTEVNSTTTDRRNILGTNNVNRYISSRLNLTGYLTRNNSAAATTLLTPQTGLLAISRSAGANYLFRRNGVNETITEASEEPIDANIEVLGTPSRFCDGRFPFYSLGANLNGTGELAELDAAITEWVNGLAAA